MRKVRLNVGGTPIGQAKTWAYPKGEALGLFSIPSYRMSVSGTDDRGRAVLEQFEVLRFGVQCKDGKTAMVVGLADAQTHGVKAWIPAYRVHSANSPENGGWQVYDNFLIHDGPDNATEVFASIGCVEVMGQRGFVKFNDLLISLSGPTAATRDAKLVQIGNARNITISYERAARPVLTPLP